MHTHLTDTRLETAHTTLDARRTTLSEPSAFCHAQSPAHDSPDPRSGGSSHEALEPEGLKGGALPASLQLAPLLLCKSACRPLLAREIAPSQSPRLVRGHTLGHRRSTLVHCRRRRWPDGERRWSGRRGWRSMVDTPQVVRLTDHRRVEDIRREGRTFRCIESVVLRLVYREARLHEHTLQQDRRAPL